MAVRKTYRSALAVRREAEGPMSTRRCDHNHRTPEAAQTCLSARLHEAARRPVRELEAQIHYSHSRHDWFPL